MLNTHKDWMAGKSATVNNKDDLIQLIKWRSVASAIKPMLKTADNAHLSTKDVLFEQNKD
ncbi:hypothetical protein B5F96_11420 [Parabacteroides johnsonii]|jgi:hypothetical protein|uniref:Uncharacterized protein n=1 Tax=Parabacteroides johnsonii TaxID=387661 RepID=A0A9Q5SR89_9BACT|nr:hypothetical protein B5F96_11420 [Parabacteroides johnsonii]